jgi:hypothetical protein
MRTTNEGELADAWIEQVRGVVPSATEHQDRRWREVDDIDAVASGEIRTFYVDVVDVGPVGGGIYSPNAIEHACTVLVYCSYGNLRRKLMRRLRDRDGRQLWLTMAVRGDAETDTTTAGLVSVEHIGWQEENDDQGRQWGAHSYAVRFLAPGIPGAS